MAEYGVNNALERVQSRQHVTASSCFSFTRICSKIYSGPFAAYHDDEPLRVYVRLTDSDNLARVMGSKSFCSVTKHHFTSLHLASAAPEDANDFRSIHVS